MAIRKSGPAQKAQKAPAPLDRTRNPNVSTVPAKGMAPHVRQDKQGK